MPLGTILLILLVLVLIGALPTWGYSGSWGYGPSGILGVILVIVLVLVLLGKVLIHALVLPRRASSRSSDG